ncbi:hypothetical protein MasN3_30920 [Massilia varians]|uniref:SHSP domain-containing protein n=1 Tax=Massilia varians TaxID=457921 RepID=A0ABN6TGA2_9BURK|nr:hypothetical protein MasN3_30920 [Massilia varians]
MQNRRGTSGSISTFTQENIVANNLTRFAPFHDVMRMSGLRNIEDPMRDFALSPALRSVEHGRRIRIGVKKADQACLVKADMPGFKEEDIKIPVEGRLVSIGATIYEQEQKTVGDTVCSERCSGSQVREGSKLPCNEGCASGGQGR